MNWESIEQVLRILCYAMGGYLLGEGVVESNTFQSAVGGFLSIGAFIWWIFWEKGHRHVDKKTGV